MFRLHRAGKPNPGALIDWSQPLAYGLSVFYACNEGSGGPIDSVSGVASTNFGPAWIGTPYGTGLSFGATTYLALNMPYPAPGVGANVVIPCSFAMHGAPMPGQVNQHWFDVRGTGSGTFLAFNFNGSNEVNVGTTTVSNANLVDGGWHTWGLTINPGPIASSYRDGAPVGTGVPLVWAFTAPSTPFFGGNGAGASLYGPVSWFAAWSRALDPTDHQLLAANPWSLFAAPGQQWFGGTASPVRSRRSHSDRAGSRGAH